MTRTFHTKETPLTAKQAAFVEEYLIDLNGAHAAIRAGYSKRTAGSIARDLMDKPNVLAAIQTKKEARSKEVGITAKWVLEQLEKNYHRAMQEEEVLDREGNATGEFRYEGNVANRSLELIGKHLGMFVEKIDTNISHTTGPILYRVELPERDPDDTDISPTTGTARDVQ